MKIIFCTSINEAASPISSRKLFAVIFVFVMSLLPFISFAQLSDEEAIKEVVKSETKEYSQRNAEGWQATWLQDAKSTRTLVYNNNYSSVVGWDNFGQQVLKEIKENPTPFTSTFENSNFIIHNDGTMAWVEFDQTITAPNMDPSFKSVSREHRALVKKDGQWKIFSQLSHYPETFASTSQAIENNLNTNGYYLMSSKKIKEAIEVFKLNVQLFPQSWNTVVSPESRTDS